MRWNVRWGICMAVSCVLLVTHDAGAAEKVTLKLNLPPGTNWTFENSQRAESQNTATAKGQSQEFSTKMTSRRAGKAEVTAAAQGEPASLRITFDDTCENNMTMGPQTQKTPFPYAGKTVTLTRNADGTVSDDFQGQADAQSVAELHAMLIQENLIFPQQPVAIGEEWKAEPKLLSQVTDLKGADDRAGMTLQLIDVSSDGGKRLAKIKVSTAIERSIGGINSTVILQGTALVDLVSGHTLKSELKGPLTSSGDQSGPGPGGQPVTYHIEGKGTITSSSNSKLNSGGGNAAAAPANPLGAAPTLTGKFTDGKLTVDWSESNGSYSGTIALGDKKFDATGKADGSKIKGTFSADGNTFPFEGALDGDTLRFITAGTTYTLQRQKRAVNPLEGGGEPFKPKNPLAPGAAATPASGVPQGYELVSASEAGRAMATRKASTTVRSALASTLPEIAGLFDTRPKITGAYEDVRDHRSGGAAFTAMQHGQPVKGMISCKLMEEGTAVAVVYAKADATAEDWSKLTTTRAATGGTAGSASVATPAIPPLKTYEFPDGTGSIGIPDGWKTDATSCYGTVIINGPAGQVVTMGLFFSCVTPDSAAVRTYQSLVAYARQYGNPVPPQTALVSKWVAPINIFETIVPQLNRFAKANGKPGVEVDHLEHQSDPKAILPNGKASLITYGITEVEKDQRVHRRVLAQIEADPTSNESFLFGLTGAAAPDATFTQNLPTMLAIITSLRENAAVIQVKTQQNIDQQNQWFASQQKSHEELMASYDSYNKAQARNSTIRSRSNDDFSEVIRGYRSVEDTRTGEKHSVDLGNVDNIVDALNRSDPGRYKQVPLRDEMDPLRN